MDISAIRAEARQLQSSVKGIRLLFLAPILATIGSSLFNLLHPTTISIQQILSPSVFFTFLFNRTLFPWVMNFVLSIFITSAFAALLEVLQGNKQEVHFQDSTRAFQSDVFGPVFLTLLIKEIMLFLWSILATMGALLMLYASIIILNIAFTYPEGIPLAQEGRLQDMSMYLAAGVIMMIIGLIISIPQNYAYSQVEFILCDQLKTGHYQEAFAILRQSRRMMKGYKGSRFILDLSFIGWAILSSFTFGTLSIYVYPYRYASQVIFYERLKHQASHQQHKKRG
ncbi:DUF975 family protein [Streptococcus pneumoniae]